MADVTPGQDKGAEMANPQLEDGHTKIANEIMDALMRVNFSPYERRVLDCILRKTYGWNKKMDRISYTQFEESTGLNRRHVARSLTRLIKRNILTVSGDSHKPEYGLQKDYDSWQSLPKLVTQTIASTGNDSLPKLVTASENESLPPGAESLPPGAESLPKLVTKSLPKLVNTKAIKHNKSITKAKKMAPQSFEEYRDILRTRYLDLDFDHEIEKFWFYWDGHNKKHTPSNKKLCLVNWMDRARAWSRKEKEQGVKDGEKKFNKQLELATPVKVMDSDTGEVS